MTRTFHRKKGQDHIRIEDPKRTLHTLPAGRSRSIISLCNERFRTDRANVFVRDMILLVSGLSPQSLGSAHFRSTLSSISTSPAFPSLLQPLCVRVPASKYTTMQYCNCVIRGGNQTTLRQKKSYVERPNFGRLLSPCVDSRLSRRFSSAKFLLGCS